MQNIRIKDKILMIKTSLNILLIFSSIFLFQSCTLIDNVFNIFLSPTWECHFSGEQFNSRKECEKHCDEGCVGYLDK